jgi:hypothetical protein
VRNLTRLAERLELGVSQLDAQRRHVLLQVLER